MSPKYRSMLFRRSPAKLFRRYELPTLGSSIYVSIDDPLLSRILKIKYSSNLVSCYKGRMHPNRIETQCWFPWGRKTGKHREKPSKTRMWSCLDSIVKRWDRCSTKFYTWKLHIEIQSITLLQTILTETVPLQYTFTSEKVPLSHSFISCPNYE